jgi:hypothetical protein
MRHRRHVTEQDDHVVWLEHEIVYHIFHPTKGACRPGVLHPEHANRDSAVFVRINAVATDVWHHIRAESITTQARHGVYRNGTVVTWCEFEQAASSSNIITSDIQEAIAAFPGTKRKALVE